MAKRRSRTILTIAAIAITGAALAVAFRPRPVMVDMGEAVRKAMMVTIDEEGRTRVRDSYVVSTPVAGLLLRIDMQPGDPVVKGSTIVAHMRPTNPAALDVRTREQARAAVTAAKAALRVAQADLNRALADRDLAASNLERMRRLRETNTVAQAALDMAVREARSADAAVETAQAAIAVREAELDNAEARLIGFDDSGLYNAIGAPGSDDIPLHAPATGRILRLIQQNETTLPAGAPIMEIGNVDDDLEVVVELLSSDAVQVSTGNRVLIDEWGGGMLLEGKVARVDPFGFTKTSALGVEEQRVITIVELNQPKVGPGSLGHGYRVEARIVIWEEEDVLTVPSNALFRDNDGWAVFAVRDDEAVRTAVEIGRNNGIEAQILKGLEAGDTIILYPAPGLEDGTPVARRSGS